MQPDPTSTSQAEEGRRIIRVDQNVYKIVNYEKYRDLRYKEERRAYQREWDREHRGSRRNGNKEDNPTASDNIRQLPTTSDTNPTASDTDLKLGSFTTNPTKTKTKIETSTYIGASASQDSVVLDQLVAATQGLLTVNRLTCMQELRRIKPPLTILELDPVLAWFKSQIRKWKKAPPDKIPHLRSIIRDQAWLAYEPKALPEGSSKVGGPISRAAGSSDSIRHNPTDPLANRQCEGCGKVGRAALAIEQRAWCSLACHERWEKRGGKPAREVASA